MRWILATFATLIIISPVAGQDAQDSAAERVNALADAYMASLFEHRPEWATLFGAPDADHGAISDRSPAAVSDWEAQEDAWYEQLQEIDAAELEGRPEWVTYGFLREALESERQVRVCRGDLWSVNHQRGWQVIYPLIAANLQPVGTEALRTAALKRFGALPSYVDTEITNLREGLRQGYSAPRGAVERVIAQLDGLLDGPPDTSPFFGPARRDSTEAFREAFAALITDSLNPAVLRYRNFLREEYLPNARTETAVSANPGGAACYRALTRRETSLDLTPEEIHRLGLEKMEEIHAEMRVLAERSFGTEDVPALLDRIRTDQEFLFGSRDEIEEYVEVAVGRARAAMPAWFGVLPQADLVIEPVPPHQEASAAAAMYVPPADDGSRPGVYRINLHNPEMKPRALMESMTFHEAIPGHHLQLAIAVERPESHAITRFLGSTAFTEGWALYAERLADEMGLFSSDLDRLGMLSWLAFRAARLVVDPGLHALGWTREQAIDYMAEHTAENLEQIAAEVDRYIIRPGQATAYMIGSEEIWRLRSLAEQKLGERFDISAFHDMVLRDGSVTLPMLREKGERWIDARQE